MHLPINKIHRRNTKKQVDRSFILTNSSIYILNSENSKIKDMINLSDISSISTSPLNDNIMIIHVKNSSKGDLMLCTEERTATKIISVISYIWMLGRKRGIQIPIDISDE
ncbi:myosin tail 2 [Neocallimastix sp. 'constans']